MSSLTTAALNLNSFLVRWLRRDGLAMLLFALTTLLMTYPLVFRLGGDWVTTLTGKDVYMKLWDIWWLDRMFAENQSSVFTNYLFYPTGVDLTFHSVSWTTSLMAWLLMPVTVTALAAYKVTILVGLFAAAYGAYLLTLELTRRRAAAWLGGAIYSFAPYHIAHSDSHPDMTHVAVIPIAALLFIRALRDRSVAAAVGAALVVGIAAFTSLYILDFALLTLFILFVYLGLDKHRWRRPQFWRIAIIFGAATLLVTTIRLAPLLRNEDGLTDTLNSAYRADSDQADLLAFVLPSSSHLVFKPLVVGLATEFRKSRGLPPYLGLIPVALTFSALTWKKKRKEALAWFFVGLFFFLMSLGPVLRINGQLYDKIPLPFRYGAWLPPLRAVRPNFFHIGLLLPLAVCSSYGLARWLEALDGKRIWQNVLVVGLSALLLFEYWHGPFPFSNVPVNPFYVQLAQEKDSSAIIELPMGRDRSKFYIYSQTIHGHPMVEGATARTAEESYSYVNQNLLLSLWRATAELDCNAISGQDLPGAIEQLTEDGFRYVIVHLQPLAKPFASYFPIDPVYVDSELTVFDLADLQATPPCA